MQLPLHQSIISSKIILILISIHSLFKFGVYFHKTKTSTLNSSQFTKKWNFSKTNMKRIIMIMILWCIQWPNKKVISWSNRQQERPSWVADQLCYILSQTTCNLNSPHIDKNNNQNPLLKTRHRDFFFFYKGGDNELKRLK